VVGFGKGRGGVFLNGFYFLNFLFLQKLHSYREVKLFPDLSQLADHSIPEGSRVGTRPSQTGQGRGAPSLAVETKSRKKRETPRS